MSEHRGTDIGRSVIIGLLVLATLGFGLAGLCGAIVTVGSLGSLSNPGPENFAGAALIIAVPSLVIGGGLAVLCGVLLARRLKRKR